MGNKQKIKYLSERLQCHLSVETYNVNSDVKPEVIKKSIFIDIIRITPLIIIANLISYFRAKVYGIPFIPLWAPYYPTFTVDVLDFKIKIEIRHNEHPPPHFHVLIDNDNYSVSIETGEFLKGGKIKKRDRTAIDTWYKENRSLLIKVWNTSRPSNCPVGIIK